MSAPTDNASMLALALYYRDERGWSVLPMDHPAHQDCQGGTCRKAREEAEQRGDEWRGTRLDCNRDDRKRRAKHPIVRWATFTAARMTDQTARHWWADGSDRSLSEYRPCNIAIACKQSGIVVIDEDKLAALQLLAAELGEEIPQTYKVRTARGWHYYFRAPTHVTLGNRSGLLASHGIDVRGGAQNNGGIVLAAGSVHASGVIYTAEDPDAELAELPAWLIAQILDAEPEQAEDGTTTYVPREGGRGRGRQEWTDEPRYGTATQLEDQCALRLDAASKAPGGAEWRHLLFLCARDAWRLVTLGLMTEEILRDEIERAITARWGPMGAGTRSAVGDEEDWHIVYAEARPAAAASPWVLAGGAEFTHGAGSSPQGHGPGGASPESAVPAVAVAEPEQAPTVPVNQAEPEPAPADAGVPEPPAAAPVQPVLMEHEGMTIEVWPDGRANAVGAPVAPPMAVGPILPPWASGPPGPGPSVGGPTDGTSNDTAAASTPWLTAERLDEARERLELDKRREELERLRRREWAQDTLKAEKRRKPRRRDIDEFLDSAVPEYLVPGMIYKDGLCTVFGPPGAAKSFHLLDICLSYAAGVPWRDHDIGQGVAYFVMGEGGPTNNLRSRAWMRLHGVTRDQLRGRFISYDEPIMLTPAGIQDFIQDVIADQPDIIVLDTKNLMFEGKESAGEDLGAMLRVLHMLRMAAGGCAVILVDHTGLNNEDRVRGGNAQKGGVDTELKVSEGPDGIRLIEMTRDKSAEVKGEPEWAFRLHQMPEIDRPTHTRAPAVAVACELPGEDPFSKSVPDWHNVHDVALPADVTGYAEDERFKQSKVAKYGSGPGVTAAVMMTARFMRSRGRTLDGTSRMDARRAVRPYVIDSRTNKPASDDTMDRAWSILLLLGRLTLTAGTRLIGPSNWVSMPGDPE